MKVKVQIPTGGKVLYKLKTDAPEGYSVNKEGNQLVLDEQAQECIEWIVQKVPKMQFVPVKGFNAGPLFEKDLKLRQYHVWCYVAAYLSKIYLKSCAEKFDATQDQVDRLCKDVMRGRAVDSTRAIEKLARVFGVEQQLKRDNFTQRLRALSVIAEDTSRALAGEQEKGTYPFIPPSDKPKWSNNSVGGFEEL